MAKFVKVAKKSEIPEQTGKQIEVEGKVIALFNLGGDIHAIDDTCTHAEASLSEGTVEGDEVTCPWHAARFNLKTGEATCPPAFEAVDTYTVRLDGDDIEVEV